MRARASLVLGVLAWVGGVARAEEQVPAERLLLDLLELPAPARPWEPISEATRRDGPSLRDEALDVLTFHPMGIVRSFWHLPTTPDVVARVRRIYEEDQRDPRWEPDDAEQVRRWLVRNSEDAPAKLRAEAAQPPRAALGGWGVEGVKNLEDLAAIDWPAGSTRRQTASRRRTVTRA
jgi:hypothetical protein